MTTHEQTRLSASRDWTDRRVPDSGSEWTARPLRPVAQWSLVPQPGGRAALEMVWSTPDPQPADASY